MEHIKKYYGYILPRSNLKEEQFDSKDKYRIVFMEFPELMIYTDNLSVGANSDKAATALFAHIGNLLMHGRLIKEPAGKLSYGATVSVEVSIPYIRERWCFSNTN